MFCCWQLGGMCRFFIWVLDSWLGIFSSSKHWALLGFPLSQVVCLEAGLRAGSLPSSNFMINLKGLLVWIEAQQYVSPLSFVCPPINIWILSLSWYDLSPWWLRGIFVSSGEGGDVLFFQLLDTPLEILIYAPPPPPESSLQLGSTPLALWRWGRFREQLKIKLQNSKIVFHI